MKKVMHLLEDTNEISALLLLCILKQIIPINNWDIMCIITM